MQTTLLVEVLRYPESAIDAIATLLANKLAVLDCTGVDAIDPALLDRLLQPIPDDWSFVELSAILDTDTMSEALATQLAAWVDLRHGSPLPAASPAPQTTRHPLLAIAPFWMFLPCVTGSSAITTTTSKAF